MEPKLQVFGAGSIVQNRVHERHYGSLKKDIKKYVCLNPNIFEHSTVTIFVKIQVGIQDTNKRCFKNPQPDPEKNVTFLELKYESDSKAKKNL